MDKYARAQERIKSGLWTVDPDAGLVYGRFGRPIGSRTWCGYTFLTMSLGRGRGNENAYAHRVIWESVHGPIPPLMQVNHINGRKDDNRLANLEVVTAAENQEHAFATGLHEVIHGEAHVNAKASAAMVRDIRARAARGETQRSIAEHCGLSRPSVGRIIRGERWTRVA